MAIILRMVERILGVLIDGVLICRFDWKGAIVDVFA